MTAVCDDMFVCRKTSFHINAGYGLIFDGKSTFSFPTIKFAIYLPRGSVVSSIQKYIYELPIFSRIFFKTSVTFDYIILP